ncbi:hypothetical protein M407DRAFT_36388, partial [Tulasnella calospora MUT 4182]
SRQLRDRIIKWRYKYGWKNDQIIEASGLSKQTIQNIFATHHTYGNVIKPYTAPLGHLRKLENVDHCYLKVLFGNDVTLYLSEARYCLQEDQ